jgi:NHL repeat
MVSRRITAAVSLLVAMMLMGMGASSALAETHPFQFSFGSFTNPNGIAVDESSGDVYVADIGTGTVQKFDASGSLIESWGTKGSLDGSTTPAKSFSFPEGPDNPAAIAVDNSTSAADPSAGDLYVMDAGHNTVDKFSADGAYLGQIAVSEPLGLSVERSGEVRVERGGFEGGNFIMFDDVYDNLPTNNLVKSIEERKNYFSAEGGPGAAFAVGPTGDGYALFTGCDCLRKLGPNGEPLGRLDNSPPDVAVAVDPITGHVYVDDQSSIMEWDSGEMYGRKVVVLGGPETETNSGTFVSSFGLLQLSGSSGQGGIAVNGTSGDIYVSNPTDGKVYVYASAAPAGAAGTAMNVTKTSATLEGTVDPRGIPVTSCEFEYGPLSNSELASGRPVASPYTQSAPCDQSPAQIGSGTSSMSVSTDIDGLQAGLLYHFRLNVTNAGGEGFSTGLFATSGPGFGIKTFEVSFLNKDGTPDVQAGSHPYEMVTNIAFNTKAMQREPGVDSRYTFQPDGALKDVIVDLPPGLVGDPNATAQRCTLTQLEGPPGEIEGENNCPLESVVGELEVEFGDKPVGLGPLKEPIYNMVPPHGVAAQFGGNFIIPKLFINAGVPAGGQYPVQAASLNSPTIEPVISTRLTMFGVAGSGEQRKPFLTLPTGCTGPLKSSLSVDSYQEPGHFVEASSLTHDAAGASVAMTGCSKLKFPPTITVAPDSTDASTSSGLTVGVHVSQKAALNPEGLAESSLRDTTVTLPEGVAINPAGADGLEACSEGLVGFTGFTEFNPEFEPGVKTATFTPELPSPLQPGANFCPDGSKIGTVKIKTPLLPNALEGAVYLAEQGNNPFGSLVAMYLVVEDPVSGTLVKLTGEVRLCENAGEILNGVSCQAPGQIVTTFKNTPDVPFEELELHFFGGERAPLTTPSRCGTYTTNASFTPWDGNGPVDTSSSFQITSGPHGTPCPGRNLPFAPSLTAGTTSIQAGGLSPFTMTMSREDGNQSLQAISLKMPPGLSGLLTGVELCPEVQANLGTCGANSQIGETIVSVGVGGKPFSVTGGKVYITGPYEGAPFGLSIVNPAKAGPFNLGQVIVRAKIEVDPITSQLTVTSDNSGPYKIPTILDGIPLQIQHVNVTINRPGFTFNPTNCNKMGIGANLYSTEGATSALSVPFQATNCAVLGFKPGFKVSTSGKTSRTKGASLDVKLTYPKAPFGSQANIRSVKVDLPKQLPSRLTTLQKACPDSTFDQNPAACPPDSRVGSAKATTPLIPVSLSGPAYFVSHGGAKFPELVVVLSGYGVTVQLHGETFISSAGITSSTFRTIPDVPVGVFELKLPEGPFSALGANANLCKVKGGLKMPTAFTAQNGAVIKQTTKIAVSGCPKAKAKAKKSKKAHKGSKK